ncbi:hypothetical protein SVI_2127 [Shewanella violacea DSS12]|uniref:Uncharacterized protein n=1 Tax=Shewanella violacea (strain JCM 10179 / CIP 106290 / LMG 19151 / DSS12) TaxID=637905 RepID=D4ZK99_SHEVD|nr:hypothetical protein SVI_2127 [Shewanella violacea DSS12]
MTHRDMGNVLVISAISLTHGGQITSSIRLSLI